MNNKEERIEDILTTMQRILNKLSRIEKQPIPLCNGETLSTKEIHTIHAIGSIDPINITDVGKHFGVTKGAASQMISRLSQKGYITKEQSPHSNKEYILRLTSRGVLAYKAHKELHGKERSELIDCLKSYNTTKLDHSEEFLNTYESIINKRLE